MSHPTLYYYLKKQIIRKLFVSDKKMHHMKSLRKIILVLLTIPASVGHCWALTYPKVLLHLLLNSKNSLNFWNLYATAGGAACEPLVSKFLVKCTGDILFMICFLKSHYFWAVILVVQFSLVCFLASDEKLLTKFDENFAWYRKRTVYCWYRFISS